MRFQAGDTVIVTLEDKSTRSGRFSHEHENRYVVEFDFGGIESFDPINVRRYSPIDDETTDEWCRTEAPKVVDLIHKAMTSILPGYKYNLQVTDGNTVEMNGISLMPATIKVESIVGVKEFPGWQLVDWKFHHATQWEPEDVSDIPISDHRNSWGAASALIKYALAKHVDQWFEAEGEAQAYAELEQGDKDNE